MLQRFARLELEANLLIVLNLARLDSCQSDLHNHKSIDLDDLAEQE